MISMYLGENFRHLVSKDKPHLRSSAQRIQTVSGLDLIISAEMSAAAAFWSWWPQAPTKIEGVINFII